MKIKSLLAFFLLFAILLGTLPLYAFATEEAVEPEAQATEADGVNLFIDEDLAVRYRTSDTSVNAVTFTAEGGTPVDVTEYTTDADGKRVFTFDGIGPHQIDKAVKIEANGTVIEEAFTITGYCQELLSNNAENAKLAALIGNLIAYANAAKAFLGEEGSITQIGTATAEVPDSNDSKLNTNDNYSEIIAAAGVRFDCLNSIYVKIPKTNENFSVKMDGMEITEKKDIDEDYYTVYSHPISPLDFDEEITIEVTSGEKTATVKYSVNSYAYYMYSNAQNTPMYNLALALYRFGKSCEAYAVNTITYNLDGGTNPNGAPAEYNRETGTQLPTPTRSGYYFGGWYATEDFSGEKLTEIPAGTVGAVVLYAKWYETLYQEDFEDGNEDGWSIAGSHEVIQDANGDKYLSTSHTTNRDVDSPIISFQGKIGTKISLQFDLIGGEDSTNLLGYAGPYFYPNETNSLGLANAASRLFIGNLVDNKENKDPNRATLKFVFEFDTTGVLVTVIDTDIVRQNLHDVGGYDSSNALGFNGSDSKKITSMEDFLNSVGSFKLRFQIYKNELGIDNIIVAEGNIFE